MPQVIINLTTPAGQPAQVNERMEGNTRIIDMLVEQVDGALAGKLRAGQGAHAAAMSDVYGLRRSPR